MGQSWHLGSDITVIENNNGDVVYNAGDGSIYTFKPDGSGGYIAPAGVYLIMEKVGSGNFTITDKNQNVYTFQDNKITQATDRNGNITSYEYINGRLNKVTDPSMRCADYSYYPDGKLWKIITPNNNSYEFVYNGDKITQIIDPLGVVDISYGIYGDQLIFTDPLNRVSSFNLNSNRQVVNVRDARTTGSDIYQTNFNQTIQDNNIVTTVTDPGNRSFTYYHDPNTGNLTKYANQMDGIWQYTWANNNMTSAQDAKGTTNYEYDNRGNVTKETRILDSYPSHNIVQRMYYDQNNRLTSYIDGNGVEQKFSYDIKGSLLSSYDENRKEAIGKKYDQYGNVVEDNPALSSTINLLTNGSFEDIAPNGIPAGWERFGSGAVLTTEGFNSHGQKALKFQTNTYVDNYVSRTLSFPYQFPLGTCLTISADIKCENVTNGYIKIVYGEDFEDEFNFKGNGTTTVIFNSELPSDDYCPVYIRLGIKGTGAISFDSVQVEYIGAGDYYTASAFSTIENGNFEHSGSHWNFTGATPTYPNTTSFAGKRSARLNLTASGTATLYQDVPVYPGEMLTLSGMVKVSNVEAGDGAYYKIDYYDNSPTPQLISTFQTGYLTGSNDWTRLVCLANAPMNAKFGRVTCVLNGTGTAYFDAVKLVSRMTYKYDYDPAGNYPIMIEDNLSNRTYHYYNNNTGRKTQFTDALSNNEYYYYDNSNRLIQVTDRLQNSAYYGYDPADNLVSSRDPRSSNNTDNRYLTQFVPNALNQTGTITDPKDENIVNTYDRSGNMINISLPNGKSINYTYDNANRLAQKTLDGGRYFNYTYDGASNLTSVVDNLNKSYTLVYDGDNRITSTTDPLGDIVRYYWDKGNNLIRKVTSNVSVYYNYDNNMLREVLLPDNIGLLYNYDENGRLFYVEDKNNYIWLRKNISYDPNGRCQRILYNSALCGLTLTYEYDEIGNIVEMITNKNKHDSYEYDDNGRLKSWTNNDNVVESYTYDAAGNLLTKGSNTYTYNNPNEITNQGFTYDDNGNMTSDGTYNYTYNAEDQLIQVNKCSDNSLVATYTYNHDGLRSSKTVYTSGQAVVTNFHWDAFGNMVRESDANGNTKRQYYYDPYGNLLSFKTPSAGPYFYYHNLLGDIIMVSDNIPNSVVYKYDPWGCPLNNPTNVLQPFRYAGYYYDEETGLYYLKSRYYSPTMGRFLTRDGYGYVNYGNPQTLNLYSYCRNNPVNSVDPTGCCDVCGFELNYDLEADNYWNQEVILPTTAMILATFLTDGMAAGSLFSRTGQLSQRINKGADIRVLGHYPEYINLSKEMGAKAFNIPTNIWNKMSPAEQWAANQKFLDRAIAKGAEFVLATPLSAIRKGSFYEKEIQYLMSKGYKLSSDGYKLIK